MAEYLISDGSTIVNLIVADSQSVAEEVTGMTAILASTLPGIGINATLIDGEWVQQDPPIRYRKRLTRYEFRSQFTAAEKVAMYDSTDTIIRIFLDDIQSAQYIDVTSQDTIDGVAYLEAQGLIAAGRSTDILAGIPR